MISYENILAQIKQLTKLDFERLIRDIQTETVGSDISSLYFSINDVRNSVEVCCPHCKCKHVIKFGNYKGNQKYKCQECKHIFNPTHKSIFFKTHKTKEQWIKFIELMLSGVSIRKSAFIVKINKATAFIWRHKIMNVLKFTLEANKVKGCVEMDDTFFNKSNKGLKGMLLVDKPKLRGVSHNLICYTTAIDKSGAVISVNSGFGKNSINKVSKALENKIENSGTIIYSDEENAYSEFAKQNGIEIVQVNSKIIKEQNKLRHVNSLHSMLKSMIRRTRGVQDKYLDKYVQWVSWCKQSSKLSFAKQINAMFNDCCKSYIW